MPRKMAKVKQAMVLPLGDDRISYYSLLGQETQLRPHTAARFWFHLAAWFQFQSSPEVTTVTGVSNIM